MEQQPIMKGVDTASITFHYIDPALTLTPKEIDRLRDDNLQCMSDRKKLHLILDLDQTLVHTRPIETLTPEERKRFEAINDAYEIFDGKYVVKLRPGAREFINQVSSMFDLSIYSRSRRIYALEVRKLLDSKDGPSRFSYVMAREDCLKLKQKGLDIVLSHERVVLIVDDKAEVWNNSGRENLIKIEPYFYFPSMKEAKGMDEELARVLSILRAVHNVFYDDDVKHVEGEYIKRDVRKMLKRVMWCSKRSSFHLIWVTKKIKGLVHRLYDWGFCLCALFRNCSKKREGIN